MAMPVLLQAIDGNVELVCVALCSVAACLAVLHACLEARHVASGLLFLCGGFRYALSWQGAPDALAHCGLRLGHGELCTLRWVGDTCDGSSILGEVLLARRHADVALTLYRASQLGVVGAQPGEQLWLRLLMRLVLLTQVLLPSRYTVRSKCWVRRIELVTVVEMAQIVDLNVHLSLRSGIGCKR